MNAVFVLGRAALGKGIDGRTILLIHLAYLFLFLTGKKWLPKRGVIVGVVGDIEYITHLFVPRRVLEPLSSIYGVSPGSTLGL